MEPPRPDRHPDAAAPIPPTVQLWRSVRAHGDTKTKLSRRTLRLPVRCVNALTTHLHRQLEQRRRSGLPWSEADLVFATRSGGALDAANVRRAFRTVAARAGLDAQEWTPRELRHSFVSLLSDAGVSIEEIARLVGHRGTVVTEAVHRKQLRPVITEGAETMDRIFGTSTETSGPQTTAPDR